MFLFIATHLGSGASILCDSLNSHKNCQCSWVPGEHTYIHGSDLIKMKSENAKIHFDKLTHNYQFTCASLYSQCRFIYVIREPGLSIPYLISHKNYTHKRAYNYYTFRLRRLCEMAKKTPGSLLLRGDDLFSGRAYPAVQKYLGLRDPIKSSYQHEECNYVTSSAQIVYDKYLSILLKMDLEFS